MLPTSTCPDLVVFLCDILVHVISGASKSESQIHTLWFPTLTYEFISSMVNFSDSLETL